MASVFEFLTPPIQKTLALYLNADLQDCASKIMNVFGVTEFDHDSENVWEWIEGTSDAGIKVNISRTHNLKAGDYQKPILIKVSLTEGKLFFDFAQRLANALGTKVSSGQFTITSKDPKRFTFQAETEFLPQN